MRQQLYDLGLSVSERRLSAGHSDADEHSAGLLSVSERRLSAGHSTDADVEERQGSVSERRLSAGHSMPFALSTDV